MQSLSMLKKEKENENSQLLDDVERAPLLLSCRALLAAVMLLASCIVYMQKIDMSIGIVCMLNYTALNVTDSSSTTSNSSSYDPKCMFDGNSTQSHDKDGPFVWDGKIQAVVLSSYFYGYILTQVLSGWMTIKFGPKRVLGSSIVLGSLATILVPQAARLGYVYLAVVRFLTGTAHGLAFPAVASMFIRWAPKHEKSRLVGFGHSGSNIGNVLALPLGGYLCENGFDDGWGSIFYVIGFFGICWLAFLCLLTSDSPSNHGFISERERVYLNHYVKDTNGSAGNKPIPWKKIFTSMPCLAIFVSHFALNWGNYLFLTELPTFMKVVLKFDIKSSGLLSSLPYINWWIFTILSGAIGDRLLASKILGLTNIRKVFNGLGLFVPMICTIALTFVTCAQPYVGVAFLIFAIGFFGCSSGAGYLVNINEVGGSCSGVLYGISNTFATIPGIIAPLVVSAITVNGTQEEWQYVFFISAAIYFVGGVFYSLFAGSDADEWTKSPNDTK